MHYWLMKTEPATFGIEHLRERARQTEHWDGVRNYQARNHLQAMQAGDQAFFYHSSCAEPGIVAVVEIVRAAYPDFTAWDPKSDYFDPKSTPAKPIWYRVDVQLKRELRRLIALHELKQHRELADMRLLQRGNRLSVMPVSPEEWRFILSLERQ